MIKRCLARMGIAALVGGFGVALSLGTVNGIGVLLMGIGAVWFILEMFILSALLFMYGVTGIAHDIGASQDRDPWNRW